MPFAGMIATLPLVRFMDLPSFMSMRPVPDAIITLSIGVCQCHAMTHPGSALATMMDGPDDGSPLATEPFAQVGSGGRVTNFISATFPPIEPIPWPAAR